MIQRFIVIFLIGFVSSMYGMIDQEKHFATLSDTLNSQPYTFNFFQNITDYTIYVRITDNTNKYFGSLILKDPADRYKFFIKNNCLYAQGNNHTIRWNLADASNDDMIVGEQVPTLANSTYNNIEESFNSQQMYVGPSLLFVPAQQQNTITPGNNTGTETNNTSPNTSYSSLFLTITKFGFGGIIISGISYITYKTIKKRTNPVEETVDMTQDSPSYTDNEFATAVNEQHIISIEDSSVTDEFLHTPEDD